MEEPLYPSYSLEKNITVCAKNINELLESVKIGLEKNLLRERHFTSEKLFCEEILITARNKVYQTETLQWLKPIGISENQL